MTNRTGAERIADERPNDVLHTSVAIHPRIQGFLFVSATCRRVRVNSGPPHPTRSEK